MDLSDGLVGDLTRVCRASKVSAMVDVDRLPLDPLLRESFGPRAVDLALTGGEDYELLIAADPEKTQAVIDAVQSATGTKVTDIGEFVEGRDAELVYSDGRMSPLEPGWKHF
jgi:thiamine-monophosphate kinase